MNKELIDKWSETGLLADLEPFKVESCVDSFESMYEYLKLKNESSFMYETIFPIIRILYDRTSTIDCEFLYNDYSKFLKSHVPISDDNELVVSDYTISSYVDYINFDKL